MDINVLKAMQSFNLWPEQRAAEYGYTLDVLQTYKGVERMRSEEATGGIAVITDPEGAEVSIDGTVVGYAPVKQSDLAPGLRERRALAPPHLAPGGGLPRCVEPSVQRWPGQRAEAHAHLHGDARGRGAQ